MRFLFFAAAWILSVSDLSAASITLLSQSGGTFTYGLQLAGGEAITMQPSETINLNGLSGITFATLSDQFAFAFLTAYTSTSVVLAPISISALTLSNASPDALTVGTLEVVSSATSVGPISYRIEANSLVTQGTVLGPVASTQAVPEPSSFALFAGGLVTIAFACRRHRR